MTLLHRVCVKTCRMFARCIPSWVFQLQGVHMFAPRVMGCLLCSLVYSAAMADQPLPSSILILDQSAPLRPWSTAIIKALRSATSGYPRGPISYYVEHLDIFGFYSPQYEDNLRVHFRDKYRGKPLGAIVSIGPSALDIAVNLRATLWPTVPIIFTAVEEPAAQRQLPPKATVPRATGAFAGGSARRIGAL